MINITFLDIFLTPLYIFLVYLVANAIRVRTIKDINIGKIFIFGLLIKILGGIVFALINIYLYDGVDSSIYFLGSCELVDVFFQEPIRFFHILYGQENPIKYVPSDATYMLTYTNSYHNLSVIRFTSIFAILGLKSYLLTTIIVSFINYVGVWKLYQLLIDIYPKIKNELAIAFLLLPSVIIHGSGISKDSYVLSALFLFIVYAYNIRNNKGKIYINILVIIISSSILLAIKPYLFYIVFISVIIWLPTTFFKIVKSNILKLSIIIPSIILFWVISSNIILNYYKDSDNNYIKVGNIIQRSKLMSRDFQNEKSYGDNYFKNEGLDNNIEKVIFGAPKAIFNGIFRPFVWESRNVLMIIIGIESLVILIITSLIVLLGGNNFLRSIAQNNMLVLFLVFSLTLAFFLGNTIANFGALTRLRIPLIPLYFSSLIIIWHQYIQYKELNKIDENEK